MPKAKKVLYDKPNEHYCEPIMEELVNIIEEINFLCRANTKVGSKFTVDMNNVKGHCDDAIGLLKQIKKGPS